MKWVFLALGVIATAVLAIVVVNPPERNEVPVVIAALAVWLAVVLVGALNAYRAAARLTGRQVGVAGAVLALVWMGSITWVDPVVDDLFLPVGDGRCTLFDDGTEDLRDNDCGPNGGGL
jgi:hypothetical protein